MQLLTLIWTSSVLCPFVCHSLVHCVHLFLSKNFSATVIWTVVYSLVTWFRTRREVSNPVLSWDRGVTCGTRCVWVCTHPIEHKYLLASEFGWSRCLNSSMGRLLIFLPEIIRIWGKFELYNVIGCYKTS